MKVPTLPSYYSIGFKIVDIISALHVIVHLLVCRPLICTVKLHNPFVPVTLPPSGSRALTTQSCAQLMDMSCKGFIPELACFLVKFCKMLTWADKYFTACAIEHEEIQSSDDVVQGLGP
jgi:hypothetical protein